MQQSPLATAAMSSGWMLSPIPLALLGNLTGRTGGYVGLGVCLFALIALCSGSLLNHQAVLAHRPAANHFLPDVLLSAHILAARLGTVLVLSTILLATAGYAFNEILLYWFPNFGFAALLLGLIFCLHMLGRPFITFGQIILSGISFLALLLLSIIGLTGPPEAALATEPHFIQGDPLLLAPCVLLFLGHDLPLNRRQPQYPALITTVVAVAVLYLLWTSASARNVELEALAASTVPYMTSARAIAGQFGRICIAMVLICGAAAAVNSLFYLGRGALTELAQDNHLPSILATAWQGRLLPLSFTLIIGLMLLGGLAGSLHLEIYQFGVLILWASLVAHQCARSARLLMPEHRLVGILAMLCTLCTLLASIIVLVSAESPGSLLVFCLCLLGSGFLVSGAWQAIKTLPPRNP